MTAAPRRPRPAREAAPKRPRCPICGKPASQDHRPFCSVTCADIDLYRWLGGRYVVPGEPVRDDEDIEH
ncbi:MAG: DNA gyrase inhibitor YacG [Methyloceanibacter sp.]|nr:DNA gyrase inhibitor YacG [Methyloceanibacter sp.]